MTKTFCDGCGAEVKKTECEYLVEDVGVDLKLCAISLDVGFSNQDSPPDICKSCFRDAVYKLATKLEAA